jgi:predicted alpha/beta-fold hydrolase
VFKSIVPSQFDERFTVRITKGVNNLEELYYAMSCYWGMDKIKTDMLFINTLDDPVSLPSTIPMHLMRGKENFFLALLPGGHH